MRPERYIHAKAWLEHEIGSNVQAKDTLKTLGKNKDIYAHLLELCINY